jgi:integrase
MTPRDFFTTWYIPHRLHDSPLSTLESYWITLGLWEQVFGSIPLTEVKSWHLERFRAIVAERPGQRGKLSPNTVRRHLRHLQSVFDAAGPCQRRRDECAGVLAEVPYVRPPRPLYRDPVAADIGAVVATYRATEYAYFPSVEGILPSAWWKAALSTCLSTAMRLSQIRRLRWRDVDFAQRRIIATAESSRKSRRDSWLPLTDVALRDLLTIRREDSELIFPWPHASTTVFSHLKRLQKAAGIESRLFFGWHGLRRLVLTEVTRTNAMAATQLAGHSRMETTARHYVPRDQLQRTVEELSIWRAFA